MRARRGIAQRYIDRLDLDKKGLRPLFSLSLFSLFLVSFGSFQWARAVSPVALVEAGDPVFDWRERLLDAFGGFARNARHFGA